LLAIEMPYYQEACLGSVTVLRGKERRRYLIKWRGFETLGDITCEPPDNVRVPKKEEPSLDQSDDAFAERLAAVLAEYQRAKQAGELPVSEDEKEAEEEEEEDKEGAEGTCKEAKGKRVRATSSNAPGGKARRTRGPASDPQPKPDPTSLAPCVRGSSYTVPVRQFVVVDGPAVCREGPLAALFLTITTAVLNPGLGYALRADLRGPEGGNPDEPPLQGGVDGMSAHGGFGWFFHRQSGVSLRGRRQHDHAAFPCLTFAEGDTVGVVVAHDAGVGYCVHNGRTVFRVAFTPVHSEPMAFALHLCPDDEVSVVPAPGPLASFAHDGADLPVVPPADRTTNPHFDAP
jgi:hypothetical protein